jgi:hypothetical protein
MMIYISSGLIFHRDSESEVRTFKFHQWDMIWLYLDFSHIWQKLDLHQSWWSIYHLDPFFTEIRNLKSELWNSISGTLYGHICILALFRGKLDLHQSWWSIYHLDPFFTEILNLKSELWNSISGTSYDHICILALFRGTEICQIWIPLMDLQISDFRFRISVKIRSRIYMDHHDWWRSNFQCIVGCLRIDCAIFTDLTTTILCQTCNTHVCIHTSHLYQRDSCHICTTSHI